MDSSQSTIRFELHVETHTTRRGSEFPEECGIYIISPLHPQLHPNANTRATVSYFLTEQRIFNLIVAPDYPYTLRRSLSLFHVQETSVMKCEWQRLRPLQAKLSEPDIQK